MAKRKPKKGSNFVITSPDKRNLTGKKKSKGVDKVEKTTWMKIDDKKINRDLNLKKDGKFLQVWDE